MFITLEGGEGSGKTTCALRIKKELEDKGYKVMITREPGGVDIAEKIRSVILDENNTAMDSRTEALLFAAARRQHLVEKVKPALEADMIVICDRFVDSSLVYQGYARGISIEKVYEMNLFAIEDIMPDATLFFDVTPEVGLKRINDNNRETNRLDKEKIDFHEKVYAGYKQIAATYPKRIKTIDASKTPDEVFTQAMEVVNSLL